MSFKEEYKKAYDNIVPDKEFIEQLSGKMKAEKQKNRKVPYKVPAVVAGVAIVVLICLAAAHVLNSKPKPSKSVPVNVGNPLQTPSSETGTFAAQKWYNPDDEPEKILSDFFNRLADSKQLKALYQNTENNFTEELAVSGEDTDLLAETFHFAKVISEKQQDGQGNTVYYMAQFYNGDIIKFVITDDKYFEFLDLEYIYQKE